MACTTEQAKQLGVFLLTKGIEESQTLPKTSRSITPQQVEVPDPTYQWLEFCTVVSEEEMANSRYGQGAQLAARTIAMRIDQEISKINANPHGVVVESERLAASAQSVCIEKDNMFMRLRLDPLEEPGKYLAIADIAIQLTIA